MTAQLIKPDSSALALTLDQTPEDWLTLLFAASSRRRDGNLQRFL
jgi:hypothetical protein